MAPVLQGTGQLGACGARWMMWTENTTSRKLWFVKKVAAARFKAQCLSILDHLDPEGILITKHGKPVARLLPAERASADLIGRLRAHIRVKGDIQATGTKWDAGD